jgi:acyl-CoA synthetase (AMP-forming)/AMP-acid ligase II
LLLRKYDTHSWTTPLSDAIIDKTATSTLVTKLWDGARPKSVHAAFRLAAKRYPERPLLCVLPEVAKIYAIEAGELTYAAAGRQVAEIASAFRAAGYGPGHRVGILLENRPIYFLTWFALNSLGISVVPINPDLRSAELEYLVLHSEIALAVVLPSRRGDLTAAAQASGRDLAVIAPGEAIPQARDSAPGADFEASVDHECALLYTSGTTGLPKGCVLSNDYFLICGEWYATVGGLCAMKGGRERMLTPLPTFHMNAMATSMMTMLALGGCLIALDRFHPTTWWDAVRRSEATIVHYLGVMPAILMNAPAAQTDREHAVRFGFGAGVPRELHVPFEERFGFPLVEAWAMTETGSGAVIAATHEPRHRGRSCIGRASPDLDVRILRDDGMEASSNETGELLVRHAGPEPRRGFFQRYLKDPGATVEAWQGGWFHTGDLVKRDEDGFVYFVDRKKNVIRRSGENISAVEVEVVLIRHPAIKNAAVAAVPDPIRGDEVMACIELNGALADITEREALASEIVEWCLMRLAYYKAPGYVAFVDKLPLTSTQKIQRAAVKDLVSRIVATDACIDTRALKKR